MKILYATEDEKVEIDDKGNLSITNQNGEPIDDAPLDVEGEEVPEGQDEDLLEGERDQPME